MKRLHVHVSVPDIEQGVAFYSALFGNVPETRKDDYARWLLSEPAVNFAISTHCGETGLSHLGFQMDNDEEIKEVQSRLRDHHIQGFEENEAKCCYSLSNKYWTRDPAGIAWEQFHSMGVTEDFGAEPDLDNRNSSCACHSSSGSHRDQRHCCT